MTSSPVSPRGQGLQSHRVDDFGEEVVFKHMEAGLGFETLDGHARAEDLGQAVNVQGVEAEALFNLLTHAFGPGFRPENPHPELGLGEVHPHFLAHLRQIQGEGRGAADDGGAEVLDEHDLAAGLAAGYRDDRGAQPLGAIVDSQAAGKQAIPVSHVDDIAPVGAAGGQGPGHQLGPGFQVPLGIGHGGRLAGGAGRGVNPDDLVHGGREHAEGVVVPQVLLDGQRQQADILQRADVFRFNPHLIHAPAIERHHVVDPFHHRLQTPEL